MTSTSKTWTVLIYANGNNELEPEIWQAVQDLTGKVQQDQINVVVQIGREEQAIIKLMRPAVNPSPDQWNGVRRYLLVNQQLTLLAKLGRINMSHPLNLAGFIEWGINNYPADYIVLIMGGHGYQFIGAMTDYSQRKPYLMGLCEMADALNLAGQKTGKKIDILVFDVCYMNSIEVLYEFGKCQQHAVQNLITYLYDGPLAGIPYYNLISTLTPKNDQKLELVMEEIIRRLDMNLGAFKIDYHRLQEIKKLFSDLAAFYIDGHLSNFDIVQLLYNSRTGDPWFETAAQLKEIIFKQIIYYHKIYERDVIFVAQNLPSNPKKLSIYNKLSFNRNNLWVNALIKNQNCNLPQNGCQNSLTPTELSREQLLTNIATINISLNLDEKEVIGILNKLVKMKKWHGHCRHITL